MNWETEQIEHVIAGDYTEDDHLFWLTEVEEVLEESNSMMEAVQALGRRMLVHFHENIPEGNEIYISFIKGALAKVDWIEIAKDMLSTGFDRQVS